MQPSDDANAQSRWLRALIDQHGGPLALYAAQWSAAPDDCVQEALVELAGKIPPPANAVAWLYRAVKHRSLNHARSEGRRVRREQLAWQHRLQSRPSLEIRRELLDAVATLPDELREIVILKIWGNLTFGEMAGVLGESSSTLHRRYTEALDRLRIQWEVPCAKTTKSE